MTADRIAGLGLCLMVSPALAAAQQVGEATNTRSEPASRTIELTYPDRGFLPLRRVERSTASGARKVFIETVEAPGIEGRWQPIEEAITETAPAGSTTTYTRRDVFRFDARGQRNLAATTETEQDTTPNGDVRKVENTRIADLDGHSSPLSRRVEQRQTVARGVEQTDATLFLPAPDGTLREAERTESTQHQVAPTVVRHDSRSLIRDLNGRWQPIEARSGELRGKGSTESVQEETRHTPNLNGVLTLSDRIVTRTSESNGDERVVIETYSQGAEGFVRSDSRLALRQRVSRSTTVDATGGQSTVEDVEARNPMAPNDPMRVVRRTVVSVRRAGPDRWQTERQVFDRDVNGRLVLVAKDTEEHAEK